MRCSRVCRHGHRCSLTDGHPGQVHVAPDNCTSCEEAYEGMTLVARACSVRSSLTGTPCLLPEGHAADRPDRFHRYDRDLVPTTVGGTDQ